MDHQDHMGLLRDGVPDQGGVWADFGSGAGAFTLALAELIGPTGEIYSVDRDENALRRQEQAMRNGYSAVRVHYMRSDFGHPLEVPPLDGIVMANALHFIREKIPVLRLIRGYLKPQGRLILVEYNVDQGNPWVPYPISYRTWEEMALRAGFAEVQILSTRPSRFLREIYSSLCR